MKFFNAGIAPMGPLVALATGASVNLVLEPIYSSSVWGAGWYNAAMSAHYADSAIRFEGTADIELQIGGSGNIWNYLAKWIVAERAYPRSLDISPDGARVMQYRTTGAYVSGYDPSPSAGGLNGAWNTSAGFSTSEGSFVTCSLGIIALNRTMQDPAGGTNFSNYSYLAQKGGVIATDCAVLGSTNPLNPGGYNVNPIPFWRTSAFLYRDSYTAPFNTAAAKPQTDTETVEWSVDVTQNHVVLYTCDGNRTPTALLMGPMDVTGNLVLFNQQGVFDPILGPTGVGYSLTAPYMYAENTFFIIEIANPDIASGGPGNVYMEVPAVVIESDDYSITGQDAVTNRGFGIKGLGGRCYGTYTLPPFHMSDNTGGYIYP